VSTGAEVRDQVAAGLGWPRLVRADARVGWPDVPRETLTWPQDVVREPIPTAPVVATEPPAPDPGSEAADPASLDATAPPVVTRAPITRPPGPRRARFDEDEFSTPSTVDDTVSRETRSASQLPAPARTRIFVIANQKGGVGKTTSAVNLAAALALGGLSVLVVDLDPQGNASTALGIDHPSGIPGTYEVLITGGAVADYVVDSPEAPRLKVLPATIDLAGAEIELVSLVARENRLLRALRTYLATHPTDYVLLDCPPSLGLITLNALVAATEILIPIQCEYYALEGVSQLMRTINLVKGELNDTLRLTTVLLTMFDGRTRLAAQVADEVRTHFAAETLPTVIPRSVRISEAPSYGQTVLTYHPDSAGAVSYLKAAQEIAYRGVQEDR
jgi:chromosome partitioning protein